MITRSQIETRFNKEAGKIGQCGVNVNMEEILVVFIEEIAKDMIEAARNGQEIQVNIKDLEEIANEFFFEDYLVTFKNKRKARARAKERVKTIIEDTLKNIQR